MIVFLGIASENTAGMRIEFDHDPAFAASLLAVNLVLTIGEFFFIFAFTAG
jgi:hypothetical protein